MAKRSRGNRNIAWIEKHCRIPEGRDVGKPVRLRSWQKDDVRKIYDNPHGTRLAIISYGKKNAKTTMAAFLLLLHLAGPEARANTQLPSTAQSRDQAAVLFSLAAKIVRMSPTLNEVVTVRDTAKQLFCSELGTMYKALSAEASTAHGQSPVFAVHDELGQVKGPVSELFTAIENAMGAHEDPLSIVISTQAPTDADLLSVLIDDAIQGHDPHVVLSLYTADPKLDAFSEEAIKQANPAYGDFLNKKEVMNQAANAKRMPAQEPLYRNYTLNQRVEMSSPFINRTIWDECGGEVLDFTDRPVFAGLDLSETSDLTALVMVAPINGQWHVKCTFWLPEEMLMERSRKDRVPYNLWKQAGYLETTPGKSIEYEWVAKRIQEIFQKYDIKKIAFDRWNWRHFKPWLEKLGMSEKEFERFEEFGQGTQSMSPALRTLEAAILNGKLRHGGHPVLTMCANNAVVSSEDASNRKLVKAKSRGRIDGMVALAMGIGVASAELLEQEPKYQAFFF